MSTSSSKGKGKATVSDDHDHHGHDHTHDVIDEDDAPADPVVTAAEIEEAMEDHPHFLNPAAGRESACLSDMAGMEDSGMGVHRVRLAAGRESTVLHSHLAEAEWVYVLTGNATLVLARGIEGDAEDLRPPADNSIVIEEREMGPGDFAGFPAGNPNERWAHMVRAGAEDVVYLLGGARKSVEVFTYPTMGKTLVSHEESGAEAMFEGRAEP